MTLSETYFYILVFVYVALSLFIIAFTEDLKSKKVFRAYLKSSLLLGIVGIIIEVIGWTFFCRFNLTLVAFTPFITLISCRLIEIIYKTIFKEEPFAIRYGLLVDGMWVKNKGNIKRKNYYALYSTATTLFPTMIIAITFVFIEKNLC